MTTDNLPAIRACRPAWNKGRIVGQKRPLQPKHVWAIRVRRECPIFCVSVIWSMLPERSKDDDDFERTAGRTAEGLQAA